MKKCAIFSKLLLICSLLLLGTSSGYAYTIAGFQNEGHYFSSVDNPNDCQPLNINNTWSAVACIHMLFDYWDRVGNNKGIYDGGLDGKMYPQEEIAHVANVNDVAGVHFGGSCDMYCPTGVLCSAKFGTAVSDYLRAVHFSKISASADGKVSHGYSWQQNDFFKRGYTGLLIDFNTIAEQNRWPILKALLDSGYPTIAFISIMARPEDPDQYLTPAPAAPPMGHAVLLIGYDESAQKIEVHDPWFGPNKYYSINSFHQIWNLPYPDFQYYRYLIFASPWDRKINITFPSEVYVGDIFTVSASVTYEAGSIPISFPDYPVSDAVAGIVWDPAAGLQFAPGEQYFKPVGVYTPHSTGNVSWQLIANHEGSYKFTVEAGGLLSKASYSYRSYTDVIGGNREQGSVIVLPSSDDDINDDIDDDFDDDDTDDTDDDTGADDDTADDSNGGRSGKGCGGCTF